MLLLLFSSPSASISFPNLGILFTGKKEVPDILLRRKQNELRFRSYEPITAKVEERLRKEAEAEAKDMNLNSVKICFEAFVLHQDALYPVCVPVYSKPIANQSEYYLPAARGHCALGEGCLSLLSELFENRTMSSFPSFVSCPLFRTKQLSFHQFSDHLLVKVVNFCILNVANLFCFPFLSLSLPLRLQPKHRVT